MKKTNASITILFTLTLIGALLLGGVTAARFTGAARVDQNVFESGELEVRLDRENGNQYFDIANIAPGDQGSGEVVISNPGPIAFEYQLVLDLSGDLASGTHPLDLLVYDSAGSQVDSENMRSLAAGEQETLMVVWQMPTAAGNQYQGASARLDLIVQAEQITG
ncbi:hypothetical protein KQH56_00735 [bacterium]|nr:hypothetical protein [bacterium]